MDVCSFANKLSDSEPFGLDPSSELSGIGGTTSVIGTVAEGCDVTGDPGARSVAEVGTFTTSGGVGAKDTAGRVGSGMLVGGAPDRPVRDAIAGTSTPSDVSKRGDLIGLGSSSASVLTICLACPGEGSATRA